MRVLFLDIDGVILSGEELWASGNPRYLPPHKVELLNEVIERTGAVVVVSSTWRHDRETPSLLRKAGFRGRFHDDWRTERFSTAFRGAEIAEWLTRHPEVERYAILDDDSDMLENQRPFFVQTRFTVGLMREHVEALVDILSRECALA